MARKKRLSAKQQKLKDQTRFRIRDEERVLEETCREKPAERVLFQSVSAGFAAGEYARTHEQADVICHFLDVFDAQSTVTHQEHGRAGDSLNVICTPDLPEEKYNLIALPFRQQTEGELLLDWLDQAYLRLEEGGELVVTATQGRAHWVHQQLQQLFSKVTKKEGKKSVMFSGRRKGPLKRDRRFDADVSYKFEERIMSIRTRPGVFCHRRMDDGARALIKVSATLPGNSLLDLGCGCGVVGITLANAERSVRFVDSNARAVSVAAHNAEANGVTDAIYELNCNGTETEEQFDLILANPPYFSNFKIAELFAGVGYERLSPEGTLVFVTKTPEWFEQRLPLYFGHVESGKSGKYAVIIGREPHQSTGMSETQG